MTFRRITRIAHAGRNCFELGGKLALLSGLALLGCGSASGSEPLAPPPPGPNDWVIEHLANKRIVWVAPHADDEVLIAPVMGEACVHRDAQCTLLLTTLNAGWCPYGPCRSAPDTVALRMEEHREAAAILNAEPAYLDPLLPNANLPNGRSNRIRDAWRAAAGGHEELVQRFVRALSEIDADVVITFDPRHGSSCHPDHRVTAELVLEALERSASAARVMFVATSTRPADTQGRGLLGPRPFVDEPDVLAYDASEILSLMQTGWTYFVWILANYRSQFTSDLSVRAAAVPPARQLAFTIPAAAVTDRSEVLCTGNP